MAYILFCGLVFKEEGAQEKEGFHNTFEEKENRQDVTLNGRSKTTSEIRARLSDAMLRF